MILYEMPMCLNVTDVIGHFEPQINLKQCESFMSAQIGQSRRRRRRKNGT